MAMNAFRHHEAVSVFVRAGTRFDIFKEAGRVDDGFECVSLMVGWGWGFLANGCQT